MYTSLESIANIKNPLVRGASVSKNALIASGRCRENTQKVCNKCKNLDIFGNKKCLMNGRA